MTEIKKNLNTEGKTKSALKVLAPGAFTTVQDLGRFGFQRFGVPPCGAADRFAAKAANLLLGNHENDALLEMTFVGGTFKAMGEFMVSVTGAAMPVTVNGEKAPCWSSFPVHTGDTISFGQAEKGCRTYLGISGGVDVPMVMGSRSCYAGAGIGGFKGRALLKGDIIEKRDSHFEKAHRAVPESHLPEYGSSWVFRAIPGPQDDFFHEGLGAFFSREFTVSPQANRMGYRLTGPKIKRKQGMPASIISEPSLPGGVQVPDGGDPIILLSEQTVGGYAKIATVISTDIPRVVQAMPGDRVRFEAVTLEEAHRLRQEEIELLEALEKMDLTVKSLAVMGKEYYNDEIFMERIQKYMLQI